MELKGELIIGEASATAIDVRNRQFGTKTDKIILQPSAFFVLITIIIAIPLFVFTIYYIFHGFYIFLSKPPGIYLDWALLILAFLFFVKLTTKYRAKNFKSAMSEKHALTNIPVRMSLSDAVFSYEAGDVTTLAKWTAVSEVFPSGEYWIFLVQGGPYYLPRRFFADDGAERAFVSEALSYMSEEARKRSTEAVALTLF